MFKDESIVSSSVSVKQAGGRIGYTGGPQCLGTSEATCCGIREVIVVGRLVH